IHSDNQPNKHQMERMVAFGICVHSYNQHLPPLWEKLKEEEKYKSMISDIVLAERLYFELNKPNTEDSQKMAKTIDYDQRLLLALRRRVGLIFTLNPARWSFFNQDGEGMVSATTLFEHYWKNEMLVGRSNDTPIMKEVKDILLQF